MEFGIGLLAGVLAVVAAMRSTWSPCGLSMLSTVTPVAERARGHRFWVTAVWFVLGAIAGGATLGVVAAALAAMVGALSLSTGVSATLGGIVVGVALASDVQLGGFRIPGNTRQVDENWLSAYRPWVYGIGFGWQIGVGVATYIMTAAVYAMVLLAALSANPLLAFALMTSFGLARGLAVLLGAGLTSPARVFAFHRRFDAMGAYVRWLVLGVEAAILVALAGVIGLALVVAVAIAMALTRRAPAVRAEPA
ncbi:MAG: hypothetical protein ABWZ15_01115 [Acidimicrobiia bacterium]